MSVVGLLLAAGRSRRFGGGKQLAAWPPPNGPGTLISSAFDHVSALCDQMIVVVGDRHQEVAEALSSRQYQPVHADPDADMSSSIQAGLGEALHIPDLECVVLQPGDHPHVGRQTLAAIIEKAVQTQSAVAPRYLERNGHPIAIPTEIARAIVAADLPEGLSHWFQSQSSRRLFLGVDDPSVVVDIDTLEDIQQIMDSART